MLPINEKIAKTRLVQALYNLEVPKPDESLHLLNDGFVETIEG